VLESGSRKREGKGVMEKGEAEWEMVQGYIAFGP